MKSGSSVFSNDHLMSSMSLESLEMDVITEFMSSTICTDELNESWLPQDSFTLRTLGVEE
jgi:hypothetical protein